ncbi:MAG: nucleoside kinase [Spirochaetaceae bacterium]|jgi:uridine kinase|nr:nucleoside kinase [Spirochaetaceae bacterium]
MSEPTRDSAKALYRHTLSFLFCAASKKVFPDRVLRIGHSLGDCYYFSYRSGIALGEKDVQRLKDAIADLIKRDLAIERRTLSFKEAVAHFEENRQSGTVLLLNQNAESEVPVAVCGDFIDLWTAPLLPRTGAIKAFDLFLYEDGMLLQFPPQADGETLDPFVDSPQIFSVYSEYKKWGRIVGVNNSGDLNQLAAKRGVEEFIRMSECFADKKLGAIADKIYQRRDEIKLVLIAGPSSSGKTTTAKRLSLQLKTLGIEPIAVSLDDYYLHPSKTPLDEHGDKDFECLEALDIPYLNEQILTLFDGREVTLPIFDFKTGERKAGKEIKLGRRTVLVLEGIHGLNDALTPQVQASNKFKVYVSALTQLNLDDHNRVPTSDNRLLRRMVRDYQFRGMSAERTLKMWPQVQRGAENHIFKFQNAADAVFNSALDYEIAVLKLYAEPLLRSVSPETPGFREASRLLSFLKNFYPVMPQCVPPLSVLREFIGGSGFSY